MDESVKMFNIIVNKLGIKLAPNSIPNKDKVKRIIENDNFKKIVNKLNINDLQKDKIESELIEVYNDIIQIKNESSVNKSGGTPPKKGFQRKQDIRNEVNAFFNDNPGTEAVVFGLVVLAFIVKMVNDAGYTADDIHNFLNSVFGSNASNGGGRKRTKRNRKSKNRRQKKRRKSIRRRRR